MGGAMPDAVAVALLALSGAGALVGLLVAQQRGAAAGRGRLVLGGLGLTLLLLLARGVAGRLLPPGEVAQAALDQGLAALSALAIAFTIDAALRRWLWFGRLREGDHSKVPNILIGLASLGGYALTLLLVASQVLGLDVTAVAATSGVVAIVLGVSAQQTLGQVFAGLALNMARPFRAGDSVQVDGSWGVVVDADWRAVTLRTYEGTLVTLPNMLVAAAKVTNLGAPDATLRQSIAFVVEPGTPPGRVQLVAAEALRGLPHVLAQPAPLVLVRAFEDRGIACDALFWHRDPNLFILRRDEAAQALWYAFRRAGIQVAAHRRLLAAPEGAIAAPPEAPPPLPDLLRRAPLTAAFREEERAALAARARLHPFAAGERIIRQGEPGGSLYLILEGSVGVRLEEAGAEAEIYTQGPGETFGHMSALTGAPRFATVRAREHLVVAEFGQEALAEIVAAHPEAVEAVAREILRIEAAHRGLAEARAAAAMAPEEAGLLDRLAERIRAFLGEARGGR